MKSGIRTVLALTAATLLLALSAAFAAEVPSPESIAREIESAKILPPGYKVSAQMTDKQALISTYRHPEASTGDCKIDASLIAKHLMIDKDYGLALVKVQFHEPPGTSQTFQQVVISLAELKGYAAGAVSKEGFMDSLLLENLPENQNPSTSTEREPDAPAALAAAVSKPVSPVKAAAIPASIRFTSRRTGISFVVPNHWTVQELSTGPTILRIKSGITKNENIELRFRPEGTPAYKMRELRETFDYEGVSWDKYMESTNFGTGRYPGALASLTYPNYDVTGSPTYYEMHLYFGQYDLWAWSPMSQYNVVGPAFYEVVKTMTFPTATKKAPVARPKK